MPISYEIDEGRGWVSVTAWGVVTDNEATRHHQSLIADSRFRPGMKVLVDLRPVVRLEVTAEGIRRLVQHEATHADRLGPRRWALVVASQVAYGMARMYQMLTESNVGSVQVFRKIDEARAWLDSASANLAPGPERPAGES